MEDPSPKKDLETLAFHFDFLGTEYAVEDHDDPELKAVIQAGVRLTSHLNRLEHVAWCRYSGASIVTCDSTDEGAFRVFKHPIGSIYPNAK